MRLSEMILLAACALIFTHEFSRAHAQTPVSECCSLIDQAIKDYSRIKVGTMREEVEKYFDYSGGFNSEDTTRYSYRKCPYIQVVIDFRAKHGKTGIPFSPRDTVEKKSKLFLEYGIAD